MAGEAYQLMQDARKALRHAAHVYANTKKTDLNKPNYEAAAETLDKAAITFAMAAAAYGMTQSDAPPANSVRDAWEARTNPDPDIPRKR